MSKGHDRRHRRIFELEFQSDGLVNDSRYQYCSRSYLSKSSGLVGKYLFRHWQGVAGQKKNKVILEFLTAILTQFSNYVFERWSNGTEDKSMTRDALQARLVGLVGVVIRVQPHVAESLLVEALPNRLEQRGVKVV